MLLYIRQQVHTSNIGLTEERSFKKSLNPFQRFVSFERNWDAALLAHEYVGVSDVADSEALQDLGRRVN